MDRLMDKEVVGCVCVCVRYSAIKKKEILPFRTAWMDFEGIMLSEISWTETDKYFMISLIYGIIKKKKLVERDKICGYQREGVGVWELDEGGKKVQTSRYKINKSCESNVQHDDYT